MNILITGSSGSGKEMVAKASEKLDVSEADVIISGGENIYSVQVEEAIAKHDAVLEVAVIGVPDDEWGESVKAYVVLKPGRATSEAEIIQTAKANLASYQKPRSVEFVDALPKAPTGKILKRELREKHS